MLPPFIIIKRQLLTNHCLMWEKGGDIKSKDDVIKTAKLYFSRWKIEEYFRCKKQLFQFENFRVRKLKAINSLNFYLTLCMAFGSGQSALHTVNSALSRLFEQIKEYVSQSPIPVGLIKVPLFTELPFYIFQKSGRLVLWEIIFILELQFAETQGILTYFQNAKIYQILVKRGGKKKRVPEHSS